MKFIYSMSVEDATAAVEVLNALERVKQTVPCGVNSAILRIELEADPIYLSAIDKVFESVNDKIVDLE